MSGLLDDRVFFGEFCCGAALGRAGFFSGGGHACARDESELCDAEILSAKGGVEDLFGIGVDADGEHVFREVRLNLERVADDGEGGVFDLLGGGLLAFDVGEGGDEGGVKCIEVTVGGCRDGGDCHRLCCDRGGLDRSRDDRRRDNRLGYDGFCFDGLSDDWSSLNERCWLQTG